VLSSNDQRIRISVFWYLCKIRSSATAKSTARSSCLVCVLYDISRVNIAISDISLKIRFFGLHFTRWMYQCIFNNFYLIGPKAAEFGEITQSTRPLRRSGSFKVTDFGTNWKSICKFLIVNNTNLPPILHRFQIMADYWSNFRWR